ncbi:MAG: hypothetical protein HW403_258 [Dehalococcoidia bacterium]|nr:hypothetical protein [Dehalococcoidia bacterium]
MTIRQKDGGGVTEEKRTEAEQAVKALQELLSNQQDPRLHDVSVWLERVNGERGVLHMGVALGQGLGCSPFCGCAAKQLGDQFEPFLMERLPWLTRVIAEAEPPKESESEHPLLKML